MNEIIEAILLGISQNVYCYTAPGNHPIPYIVYGVDGENVLSAGDGRAETADSGYVDFFTKDPEDKVMNEIPAALDAAGISYYLNSVQYEEETGLLHYEWRWECARRAV